MPVRVITIQLVSEDPGAIQTAHGFVRTLEPICDRTSITVLDEPVWQARQRENADDVARLAAVLLSRHVDTLAGLVLDGFAAVLDRTDSRQALDSIRSDTKRLRDAMEGAE